MRPLLNASKFIIAALAVILTLTGLAEARDSSERRFIRRSHHESGSFHGGISGRNMDHERRYSGNRESFRRDYDRRRPVLSGRNERRSHHWNRHADRRHRWDNRRGRDFAVREYRSRGLQDDRNDRRQSYNGNEFPSFAPGGAYLGGLSAFRDPGNGTYFSRYSNDQRYDDGFSASEDTRSGPKIIRVTPRDAGRACSWESGVCVIRR